MNITSEQKFITIEEHTKVIKIEKEIEENVELWKLSTIEPDNKTPIEMIFAIKREMNWEKMIEEEIKQELFEFIENNDATYKEKEYTFITFETSTGFEVKQKEIEWTNEEKDIIKKMKTNENRIEWLKEEKKKFESIKYKSPLAISYKVLLLIFIVISIFLNEIWAMAILLLFASTLVMEYVYNKRFSTRKVNEIIIKIERIEDKGFLIEQEKWLDEEIGRVLKKFKI